MHGEDRVCTISGDLDVDQVGAETLPHCAKGDRGVGS
jgi:hypothetical protein